MIPAVGNLISRIQSLLDDPTGKWADHNYLVPFVQQVNEDLYGELASLDLKYSDQTVILQNIPANTTDLSAYQATGGLLEYLMVPNTLEWRPVGYTDLQWLPVPSKDQVVDTSDAGDNQATASVADFVKSWEWRGSLIYISPCDQAVDLRVRFEALPAVMTDDEQEIIRGLMNVLAYRTTELVAETRGAMGNLAAQMKVRGDSALENFEILMVKKQQFIRRRIGRANRGHLSRYGIFGMGFIPGS